MSQVNQVQEDVDRDPKVIREKVSKNLLWFGIVSIVMLFGGLTSAIIVSQGGTFWVNIKLPSAFWISTGIILLSSLTLNAALQSIKKNKIAFSRYMILATFILGIGFSITQYIGWKQLYESGLYFTDTILEMEQPKLVDYTDKQGRKFLVKEKPKRPDIIVFRVKGEYGKDFTISYKGEILSYKDGILYNAKGPISPDLVDKLAMSRNTASSFVYFLTALHLAHILGGLIYLLVVVLMSFKSRFNSSNYLKIKLSAIYWHFLGILWIYLFLFLQYIH